ncbi:MAG: FAD-dependent oxidoreductase [Rhodobacterales bacterium]|nr:FAD-dependent oxidoreductase [Rhodobacterales bacterium]
MSERRVLVVGAGPAGLCASLDLAAAGLAVVLVDRAPRLGGAVYPERVTAHSGPPAAYPQGKALIAAIRAQANRIDIRTGTTFAGIDGGGTVALTGAHGLMLRPAAVILATGARELVQPRPGWTLPGVTTVGAVQVALKTAGQVPEGAMAIAGSGPLLYALGAQLARAGRPPLAVIDAAHPARHPLQVLRLPLPVLREAVGYLLTLRRAGVPVLSGTHLAQIAQEAGRLRLTLDRSGRMREIVADRVALHDGIATNDYGQTGAAPIPLVAAGDCNEVLGRFGAAEDGRRAAAAVITALGRGAPGARDWRLTPYRVAQTALAKMFAHDGRDRLARLPDDTVICRCENRTLADLSGMAPEERTPRLLRLTGRFGMGPCQGRGCLDWVAALADTGRPPADFMGDVRGARWPVAPIPIADLLAAEDSMDGPMTMQKDTHP